MVRLDVNMRPFLAFAFLIAFMFPREIYAQAILQFQDLGAKRARMQSEEEQAAKLPFVKSGLVSANLVAQAKLSNNYYPPRPTKKFPLVWGDDGSSVQVVAPAEPAVPVQSSGGGWPVMGGPTVKPKLAVMEIEDQSGYLSKDVTGRATDYLRATVNSMHVFVVIDKGRQADALNRMVVQQKTESYKDCYNRECQIPLGQALAADTILRTQIVRIAGFCTLGGEIIDLAKEASIGGGVSKFDCTEDGLGAAIEELVPQLANIQ